MRRRQVRPGVRGRKPTCARQGRRAGSEGVAGAGPGPLLRWARRGGARRQVTRCQVTRCRDQRPSRSPTPAPGCPRARSLSHSSSPFCPAPPPACSLTSLQVFSCFGLVRLGCLNPNFRPTPRFSSPNSGSPMGRLARCTDSSAPCPQTWEAGGIVPSTEEKTEQVLCWLKHRGSAGVLTESTQATDPPRLTRPKT